ncbi:MAG: Na/Pi cotransporter family protein [Nitrospirae bacterium]|nr:Na/Pi cotransporter family protein [Nitrospirota bacterium]
MEFIVYISLFGGVLLLLYGIRLVGEGLQRAAGPLLKSILGTLTKNPLSGLGIGTLVTAILQSSSATTVMLVGFVNAGLLSLRQSMGIILGSDIGTTITVQLISFRVFDYAILLVGLGILGMLMFKNRLRQDLSRGVLGFGFIFLSIKIMAESMVPLKENTVFILLLGALGENPLTGIIISAIFTALFHSSAATIGIALAMAVEGIIPLNAAISIILGSNIGTCVTAITASIGASAEAKRTAYAHVIFKVVGVALVIPFLDDFGRVVVSTAETLPRQIANAHTLFNFAIAIIFLPFLGPIEKVIRRMVPDKVSLEKFGPRYLDPHLISTPELALGQATREVIRMADIVEEMLKGTIDVFKNNDRELLEKIEDRDDDVDLLDREVKLYLVKILRGSLTESLSKREIDILEMINNLENIGDIVDKNLMRSAKKKINRGLSFSKEGMEEIASFHGKIIENFDLAISAFTSRDADLAARIISRKERIEEMCKELKQAHINRLHLGYKESIETSSIHLDVLTNLERINSHITQMAYPLFEEKE